MNSLNGGYAMIKYNSTQEELQIAYRSKKPVLCYDENRRAHWAVIEEAATESVDEETQEPITIYEYSYRLIDEASGGNLYRHVLTLFNNSYYNFGIIEILSDNNTPFTRELLFNKLKSNGQQIQYGVAPYRFGSSLTASIEMSTLGFDSQNDSFYICALNYNKLPSEKPTYVEYVLSVNELLVSSDYIEQIF